jgi:hypothetical protein
MASKGVEADPMPGETDKPLTEEELALAREGEALISAATAEVHAPQSLREAIERDRARAAAAKPAPRWRRWRRGLAAATAVATVAAVGITVAIRSSNDAAPPSLASVEAAAQQNPTSPAPASPGGSPPTLAARVGALAFPDWQRKFGWKAVGRRDDNLSGRRVTTVFYRNRERVQLGYAVVAGDPLGEHPAGREVTREGNTYAVERAGLNTIVTWTQQGHTCVIAAPSVVPDGRLVDLAASRNV